MRLPVLCLLTLLLGGCAAAAVVSAIPGVLVDRAVGFFNGQESSLPVNMQHALAAVQKGLGRMSLHVDVLEPIPEGYALEFGNGELDGDIRLQRQTQQLTTMTVSAHRGLSHQASVETAMSKEVGDASRQLASEASFDFTAYHQAYAKPDVQSPRKGWFRPGAKLHVSKTEQKGWLKLKLPSGQAAFIMSSLQADGA